MRIETIVGRVQSTWRLYLFFFIQNKIWCCVLYAIACRPVAHPSLYLFFLSRTKFGAVYSTQLPAGQWRTQAVRDVGRHIGFTVCPSTLTTLARLVLQILERTKSEKSLGCSISPSNIRNRTPHMLQTTTQTFQSNKVIRRDKNVSVATRLNG